MVLELVDFLFTTRTVRTFDDPFSARCHQGHNTVTIKVEMAQSKCTLCLPADRKAHMIVLTPRWSPTSFQYAPFTPQS